MTIEPNVISTILHLRTIFAHTLKHTFIGNITVIEKFGALMKGMDILILIQIYEECFAKWENLRNIYGLAWKYL